MDADSRSHASPSCSPATMRKRRSRRPSPASAPRCRRRRSTSTTITAATAPARSPRAAGAIVRTERMQGKGHVVRRMFADVEADIYVMADGDATYDAAAAPALVARLLDEQLDMVVGARKSRGRGGLSARPWARQPAVHRPARQPVRPQLHRHLLGLPGLLAPLRQELPGAVARLRDRDRDQRPRARARHAGRRDRHRLRRPARRLGVEALDLSRRLADPEDDPPPLPDRAAGAVLRQLRPAARRARPRSSRSRSRSPISRPAWCRASRPRSWSPA